MRCVTDWNALVSTKLGGRISRNSPTNRFRDTFSKNASGRVMHLALGITVSMLRFWTLGQQRRTVDASASWVTLRRRERT